MHSFGFGIDQWKICNWQECQGCESLLQEGDRVAIEALLHSFDSVQLRQLAVRCDDFLLSGISSHLDDYKLTRWLVSQFTSGRLRICGLPIQEKTGTGGASSAPAQPEPPPPQSQPRKRSTASASTSAPSPIAEKKTPSPSSSAGLSEQGKPLKPDKPWDVKCILNIFCNGDSEDKEVVKKLPKLTVHKREAKQVHYKKFTGGKWVDAGFPSAGSANGTTVWVNDDSGCRETASTFYHEVTHTDQPAGMTGSQKEYDAYIKEEQWRIKKGYPPGGANFRKKIKNPKDASKTIEVPNPDAIKTDVDANYPYNPPTPVGGGAPPAPPPSVLGLTPDGKEVRLSDGTTRPPKEGDAYRLPDTGGKVLETIDSSKWMCP